MSVPKTIAALATTLVILTAGALLPPWLSDIQDRQLLGAVHSEPDTFRLSETAASTPLLDRLVLFDGGDSDNIMTLVQPIGDDELEHWTTRFMAVWNDLADAGLLNSGPDESLPNVVGWGDRTLYWDSTTGTVVSTIGVYRSARSEDGAATQEGWTRFDESSGLPVSFFFGSSDSANSGEATEEDASAGTAEASNPGDSSAFVFREAGDSAASSTATEAEIEDAAANASDSEKATSAKDIAEPYAAWIASQWGLSISPVKDDSSGTRFSVEGTDVTLKVDVSRLPYAVEVMLGLPTNNEGNVVDIQEALGLVMGKELD